LALLDTSGPESVEALPLTLQVVSVLTWFGIDSIQRILSQPGKLWKHFSQQGLISTGTLLLAKAGVARTLKSDDEIAISETVERQINDKLKAYKEDADQFSPLEKWVNLALISLIKKSSRPYYANFFCSGLVNKVKLDLPCEISIVNAANVNARKVYKSKPLDGKAILFRASERPPGLKTDPTLGWGKLALQGLETYEIKGTPCIYCTFT